MMYNTAEEAHTIMTVPDKQMENKLKNTKPDSIVLSHAMSWTITQLQFFKSKMRKEKLFLLLRQYEKEILDAFLQDDDYFSELLRYCNIQYEMIFTILGVSHLRSEKDARKLSAS